MMRNKTNRALILAAAVAATALLSTTQAAVITKDNNTSNLNLGGSWVGGIAPSSGDIAIWDATVTGSQTLSLGANLDWLGVNVVSGVGGNLTFNSGNTLALGAGGFTNTANRTLTFNNALALSADQTWTSSTGTFIPAGGVNTAGYTLTINGSGATQFKGNITGAGAIVINNGNTKFSNGMNAAASAITINAGGSLIFDSAAAIGGSDRMASLTLNGGKLQVNAASNANEFDKVAGALTANRGASWLVMAPNASRYAQFEAGSFVRSAGATMLFSGTLGVNSLASQTLGSANVKFATAPLLSNGILVGAHGDAGLLTYDAAYGVRSLDTAGMYTTSLAGGDTSHALLVNSSDAGIALTTLASATDVASLTLRVSGTGTNTSPGSGITIDGAAIRLTSGVLYANQSVTGMTPSTAGNANNKMLINTAGLDFNGQEAVIVAYTSFLYNSVANGRLEISSPISNANGLTKSGSGELRLSGSTANTYSGTTTVNEGVLTLAKNSGANAIGGDLVINGGRVQHASSNQIPNTANITINGGTYSLQYSNSGSVFQETYNNLTMNGGNYTTGTAGHDGVSNILGTMTLNAGALGMSRSDDVNVSGLATYSGGTHSISDSNSTTVYNTLVALNGGVQITNTASSAYTPITINGSATNKGGKLTLGGNLTFTGNSTNANTVTIAAPVATNMGVIDLGGATRTFNIGDGAAGDDLTVNPIIDNGGITKTGAGTLVLGGANTYVGGTTVNAGKLVVSGSLASGGSVSITGTGSLAGTGAVGAVSVGSGGKLTPGNSPGTQTYASLELQDGARYIWEINSVTGTAGTNWDQISVTGGLTLPGSGTVNIDITGLTGVGDAPLANANWDIITYANLVGTFDPARFQINTTGLSGTWTGTWSLADTGTSIQAVYSIPEPGTIALASVVGGFGLLLRRRSHRADA